MRKERVLKYLILTFVMVVSFFMFSKVSAGAVETINIQGNLNLKLEEILTDEILSGYSISGVDISCETGQTCEDVVEIDEFFIPDTYNGYPIVEIKDGDGANAGVLNGLASIKINKITGGNNLTSIGVCAFCKLNVKGIEIANSVLQINDYAFADSVVETIRINRYESLQDPEYRYTNITDNAFYSTSSLKNIVFANKVVYEQYLSADVWKENVEIENKLTYEIVYKFYDNSNLVEEKKYYFGRSLGSVAEIEDVSGFDFVNWYYENSDEEVTSESFAKGSEVDGKMVSKVVSKWQLSAPVVEKGTYFEGVKDEDNTIVYSGKNKKLEIVFDANYELTGHTVSYKWESIVGGIKNVILNDSNKYSVSYVGQSGVYNCYITVNYNEYERTDVYSLEVVVLARKIKLIVSDSEVSYGEYAIVDDFIVDDSMPLVEGELIKNFDFNMFTNSGDDIEVGLYEDVLQAKITEIGYPGDANNYIENYMITYDSGDLNVVPKVLNVGLNIESTQITYGDEENLAGTLFDVVYVSPENPQGINKQLNLTYVRENASINDVGEYKIIDVLIDDSNYVIQLDSNDYTFSIIPKVVAVDWKIDEMVYDGESKSVEASYNDVKGKKIGIDFSIMKDNQISSLINAGTYKAIIDASDIDANYKLQSYEKEIVIEKAESVFAGNTHQNKVYNGMPQLVDVTLNHNESDLKYNGKDCINASTISCAITVSVDESENYKAASKEFQLTISRYRLDVQPDEFEIMYGTILARNLKKEYIGVNNEKIVVEFAASGEYNSSILNVGFYDIVSISNSIATSTKISNYDIRLISNSGRNKIKIVPAPVEINFYFYENLVYDGTVKNIAVRAEGTSEDVGLVATVYENKIIKNAGNYRIDVSLENQNFYITGDNYLEFSIGKADYDVSNLKLNDKKIPFDFKGHAIQLEGDLPAGLFAKYEIDGVEGNGTVLPFKHTVKVYFVGDYENYNYVEPLVATLNISMTWLFVCLAIVIVVGGGGALTLILLMKKGKLRFYKRIRRSVLRNIVNKNREIDIINQLIKDKKEKLIVEEPVGAIEESIKFVKNPNKINLNDAVYMAFVDKLFKASQETKQYYSEVKNELLSYVGVVCKIKRDFETFYLNNMPIAKLDVENGDLHAYFALDPSLYMEDEYNHENAGKKKEFLSVPLKLKVSSIESLRHAKMFIRIIRKRENAKSVSNYIRVDYAKVYTAKEGSLRIFKKVFSKENNSKQIELENIQKRKLAVSIILSLVTFGIYSIYWNIKLNDEVLAVSKEKGISGVKVVIFTLITFGVYGFVWAYRMAVCVDKMKGDMRGFTKVLYLVLNLFGLSVVHMAITQHTINNRI